MALQYLEDLMNHSASASALFDRSNVFSTLLSFAPLRLCRELLLGNSALAAHSFSSLNGVLAGSECCHRSSILSQDHHLYFT